MERNSVKAKLASLGLSSGSQSAIDELAFMADYKYDSYEMYSAPVRFMEQLYLWLVQFEVEDRDIALRFVRHRLVFISQREMHDLARFLYFNQIVPTLIDLIINKYKLNPFEHAKAFKEHFPQTLRKSLFIGLSDGAKIDFFRRHHIQLSQEQVIPYYRADNAPYLSRLRQDLKDPAANFECVFLIDDFTGSGYTLLHKDKSAEGEVDGSIVRVLKQHENIVSEASAVFVGHYLATAMARDHVVELTKKVRALQDKDFKFLVGQVLEPDISVDYRRSRQTQDVEYRRLSDKYFRPEYDDLNSRKGGTAKDGFGGAALPLVLYSNAPNNSLYILWLQNQVAETSFVPLFPRIHRHRQTA